MAYGSPDCQCTLEGANNVFVPPHEEWWVFLGLHAVLGAEPRRRSILAFRADTWPSRAQTDVCRAFYAPLIT